MRAAVHTPGKPALAPARPPNGGVRHALPPRLGRHTTTNGSTCAGALNLAPPSRAPCIPSPGPHGRARTQPPAAASPHQLAPLTGTWLADYGSSSKRADLLAALGLSGLQRVTAERLIEGLDLSLTQGDSTLSIRYLTVVPFFQVREAVPLDGSPTTQPRRDLKKGEQTARVVSGGGSSGEGSSSLTISFTWPAPSPGTLVETYALSAANPRELRVRADLWSGGDSQGGPPTASATTVYRREAGWAPRYSFPGGGGFAPQPPPPTSARRAILLAAVGAGAAAAASTIPLPAAAFPPLPGTSSTRTPPSPFAPAPLPLFPRRSLSLPFAVILMRAPYDALSDTLPAYPMAAFQSAFWSRRADEWEPYISARAAAGAQQPRPPQGDLTSPPYFDFISHSQWGSLDAALDGPPTSERSPLPDPASLRTLVAAAAGDRMLRMMREGFQGETFAVPAPPTPSDRMGKVRDTVQALLDVFVSSGYALSATVTLDPDSSPSDTGGGLVVSVLGPAVLWGCAERAARGVAPNALDALATAALFREGTPGVGAILTGLTVSSTGITQTWVVGEGPVGVVVGRAPRAPPDGDGEGEA